MVFRSTDKEIKRSLKKSRLLINKQLSNRSKIALENILLRFKKGFDTKSVFSKKGKYISSRIKLHNKIINHFLRMDNPTKKPDLYIFGGVAASGKTTALKKFIKEKAIVINNDDIKVFLAKINPSPIKRYLLLHAPLLHRESQDIEKKLILKALKSKKDIILDRTLSNYTKNLNLVKKFKKKGYEITTLGTNLPSHIAILRATRRFLVKGRYVPLEVIAKKGNNINSNVLRMARRKFNKKSIVIDTSKRKSKIIFKKV